MCLSKVHKVQQEEGNPTTATATATATEKIGSSVRVLKAKSRREFCAGSDSAPSICIISVVCYCFVQLVGPRSPRAFGAIVIVWGATV